MAFDQSRKPKRSKNAKMLAQLEALHPEAHAELLELRHNSPQAYRKRLRRLAREGLIDDPYGKH